MVLNIGARVGEEKNNFRFSVAKSDFVGDFVLPIGVKNSEIVLCLGSSFAFRERISAVNFSISACSSSEATDATSGSIRLKNCLRSFFLVLIDFVAILDKNKILSESTLNKLKNL